MKEKKEYVIESKGYNYVRDSIERRKKELEQLKQKINNGELFI